MRYHFPVIIDFHTHIFPAEIAADRTPYLDDATFREIYASPRAQLATADDLLAAMDEAGVDASVALGFAWGDAAMCARHNDYLLATAAGSGGRIIPFCTVNPILPADDLAAEIERCAAGGARGLGELRPDSQGWPLDGEAGARLASLAAEHGLPLLFHVSEPVGHRYPGKAGGSLASFYTFAQGHPELTVIGAHLAGGLPFYAPMPEVREVFSHTYVDTAAERLLYEHSVYESISRYIGDERILFGSDFPLVTQKRELAELRGAVRDADALTLILGGNAARLLGIVNGE